MLASRTIQTIWFLWGSSSTTFDIYIGDIESNVGVDDFKLNHKCAANVTIDGLVDCAGIGQYIYLHLLETETPQWIYCFEI